MLLKREKTMGRFALVLEVANYRDIVAADLGTLPANQVRRARVRGIVESGASHLVIPAKVAKQLGLPKADKIKVCYADGRHATRDAVHDVHIEMFGRHRTFTAVVEPKREDALIGAIVLEAFDVLPDCNRQRLVPRDPDFVVSEIE